MTKEKYPLHKKVGNIFEEIFRSKPDFLLLRDLACGGKQHIPLFCSETKSRETELCDVDLLVLKDNKIRAIAEIEESNVKPTQICGKFLTSALSKSYIHESNANKPVEMADSVLFIQIVDASKLVKDKTAKKAQWDSLEESINQILPPKGSKIAEYRLFTSDKIEDLKDTLRQLT